MSDWYDVSGAPTTSSSLSSSTMRAEFALVETAMAKLPTLTGNGNKLIQVNSGATALEAVSSTTGKTFTSATVITGSDNSNAMLRVTQTGTGHIVLFEDAANPDATPWFLDGDANVVHGHTSALTAANQQSGTALTPSEQQIGTGNASYMKLIAAFNSATANSAGALILARSKNATAGSHTAVVADDRLGYTVFEGSDGTEFIRGADVVGTCDGTVSTGVVPGRLVFRTATAAGTLTEGMRIDKAQNVVIGTAQLADASTDGFLHVPGTTSGAPSGTPTSYSGRHPIVIDDTNHRIYVYSGGAWKYAALT